MLKENYEIVKKQIKYVASAGALLSAITFGTAFWSYNDMDAGLFSSSDARMKNGAAAVIAGLVSEKLYQGNNNLEFEIEKFFWPDNSVTGTTKNGTIDTIAQGYWSESIFTAKRDKKGKLEGRVNKAKFNWKVESDGKEPGNYEIKRILLQWNCYIENLKVENGSISGTFTRPGWNFDMKINGHYDLETGKVEIDIDNSWIYGITLKGTVKPKN